MQKHTHTNDSNGNSLGFGPRLPGQQQTAGRNTIEVRTNLLVKRETDIMHEFLTRKTPKKQFLKIALCEFMHICKKSKKSKI